MKWDHIFYTGNGTVGRVIARSAAEHLTPCTLELGGKSPAIVDPSNGLDMATTARRLAFGKWFNCGQTCIAPDYILLPRSCRDEFVDKLKEAVKEFYGSQTKESDSFGRIVSDRHWTRLSGYGYTMAFLSIIS
jgi:acyl-CoA reductase-like NAD-dependent aldehyde dehydrogenase